MYLSFRQHLLSRGLYQEVGCSDVYIDLFNELVTFPLWSSTGQLLGYQRYDWQADKLRDNDYHGNTTHTVEKIG